MITSVTPSALSSAAFNELLCMLLQMIRESPLKNPFLQPSHENLRNQGRAGAGARQPIGPAVTAS